MAKKAVKNSVKRNLTTPNNHLVAKMLNQNGQNKTRLEHSAQHTRTITVTAPDNRADFVELFFQGRFKEAIPIALKHIQQFPQVALYYMDASACYAYIENWGESKKYALQAIERGYADPNGYDGLAHACFSLGQMDEAMHYGLKSLQMKANQVGTQATTLPPRIAFNPNTPERNIIAFSLYGAQAKYCETAVLNAQLQPQIYPNWRCRFYVDETVPQHVTQRMQSFGAQVVWVNDEQKKIPGTMWRFLAADDPNVDFALFRDADSLISQREAWAVEQWIDSNKHAHCMRDNGSHTELLLAGMWGISRGLLSTALLPQMIEFTKLKVHPTHADQYFLRQKVWPIIINSLLQHDPLFGFMDALPFETLLTDFSNHVGSDNAAGFFSAQVPFENNVSVDWGLFDKRTEPSVCICRYHNKVQNGVLKIEMPKMLIDGIRQQHYEVRLFSPQP